MSNYAYTFGNFLIKTTDDLKEMMDKTNELAEDGWRVISIVHSGSFDVIVCMEKQIDEELNK